VRRRLGQAGVKQGGMKQSKGTIKDTSTGAAGWREHLKKMSSGYISSTGESRCGQCHHCQNRHLKQACLEVKVARNAKTGHPGAQLTALGDKSIGWRIEVYWPLDDAWYEGTVEEYDTYKRLLSIRYDDNAIEKLKLYEMEQQVRNVRPCA